MRKLGKTLDPGLLRGDVSEGSGQSLVTPAQAGVQCL